MTNLNGEIVGVPIGEPMEWYQFDQLPRAYKELLWYGFISVQLDAGNNFDLAPVELYANEIKTAQVLSCLKTYGPDHPQAHFTLENLPL